MKQALLLIAGLAMAAALAGCGSYKGLQNAGQAQVEVSSIGISAGTNPATGTMGIDVGQKKILATYNSQVAKDANGNVVKLASTYGGGATSDAPSMFTGKNMQISAGANGAAVGGGDVASFGSASFILGCQYGAVVGETGNTGEFCMEAFRMPGG